MPILTGSKWGASQVNGTPGGVVTWSLINPGLPGVSRAFETNRSDITTDPSDTVPFNVATALKSSFAEWSRIANIDFVRVADGNETVGRGDSADIRIAFGELDGASGSTLALAFFPTAFASPISGDILFDGDEVQFYSDRTDFRTVAIHEIGHSIGLDHISGITAIMNPRIGAVASPQADDIDGITQVYGPNRAVAPVLKLSAERSDVTVLERFDRLEIDGTTGDNVITGGRGDEFINGRNGMDDLRGLGGNDTIFGGGNADELRGGRGRDQLDGGGNRDFLNGNGGADLIDGNRGRDTLMGAGGSDTMIGGGGKDRLNGQFGDDVLTGGNGADVFAFTRFGGQDRVTDFRVGVDLMDYSTHSTVSSFADIGFAAVAGGVSLLDGAGGSVLVEGLAEDDLSASDFIF
ncbi:MAG: matrixin family metalloprotease [Pseudomonadota bacterium]